MFIGSLPPASNKATWRVSYELRDEDNELVDLSDVTEITVAIKDQDGASKLSATLTGNTVEITDTGVFTWTFTASQMRSLDPTTYNVGCTLADSDGETLQLLIGQLPVLDGIVT